RDHPGDQVGEATRKVAADLAERRRIFDEKLGQYGQERIAFERWPTGQGLVENAAEREDVDARTGPGIALGLLPRHVPHRPKHRTGLGGGRAPLAARGAHKVEPPYAAR